MSVSAGFLEFVLEQLASVRALRSRRMFGGVGLYADEVFFGLIDDDVLYLKVDDSTRSAYIDAGGCAFAPFADQPERTMSYYSVPPNILEDPEELARWARGAIRVAAISAAHKKAKAKKVSRRPAERKQKANRSAR